MSNIDVVLVILPMWSVFTPPLGISYLTAMLRRDGYKVKCMDFNAETFSTGDKFVKDRWAAAVDHVTVSVDIVSEELMQHWCRRILELNPKMVGFSVFYSNYWNCLRMAKYLKVAAPEIKTVFGGPNAPYGENNIHNGDQDFINLIDFLVVGEGEKQIIDLIKHIKFGTPIVSPNTIDVKNCGKIDPNIRKQLLDKDYLIKDISEIPYPDFSDYDFGSYRGRQLPLMFTRGCVSQCKYCWETVLWGNFVRQRTVDNVIGEIKNNQEKYGITSYIFNDSAVNNNPLRLNKFAQRVVDEKIPLSWWGQARIHRSFTPEYLKLLKDAGCTALSFGVESFSQRLLDDMGKNYTQEEIKKVILAVHESGIRAHVAFMVGFPGETEKDLDETEGFINDYGKLMDTVNVSTLDISPGTEYHERFRDYKIEFKDGNWSIKAEKNTQEERNRRAQRLTSALEGKAKLTRGLYKKERLTYKAMRKMVSSVKAIFGEELVESLAKKIKRKI